MPAGFTMSSLSSEAQFVSYDGTALKGESINFSTSDGAPARRSISIFSRRGADDHLDVRPSFAVQARTNASKHHITSQQTPDRQRKVLKRRSAPAPRSSPKTSRGTVLNAVPAASPQPLTTLEESSPRDDMVMSANNPWSTNMSPTSPESQRSQGGRSRKRFSDSPRVKPEARKSIDPRIGTWFKGTTHWDPSTRTNHNIEPQPSSLPEAVSQPPSPMPAELPASRTSSRPQLSVVIPGSTASSSNTSLVRPTPQPDIPIRPVGTVAPAAYVSKFNSAAAMLSQHCHKVSPIEPPTVQRPVQIIVENENGSKKVVSRKSRSSSSESSFLDRDDASFYSRRSSATSVEAETAVQVTLKPARRRGTGQTGSKAFSIISPVAAGVFDYFPDLTTDLKIDSVSGPKPEPKKSLNTDKPLPPRPLATPPESPLIIAERQSRQRTSSIKSEPSQGVERPKHAWKSIPLSPIHQEDSRTSSYLLSMSAPVSPTLSEAEEALKTSLSQLTTAAKNAEPPATQGSAQSTENVPALVSPPMLPAKSRKRAWLRKDAVEPERPVGPTRRKTEGDLRKSV